MTCRSQYSGSVTSRVTNAPSTQLTNGTAGGEKRISRTTRAYSASIGFISGEWNACETTSAFVLMPSAVRRAAISATAVPAPEMTTWPGALTAAIASDPLSAPALNSLGYTLAERGERLPEAVSFIERALKVEPDNPSYLDSLGWALFKQGRAEEAEPYLRKAADALPSQSVIHDHYGDVLLRRGKLREAIGAWERALAGDGEDVDRAVIQKKIKDAKGRQQ